MSVTHTVITLHCRNADLFHNEVEQIPAHEYMHESQLLMGAILTQLEEYEPSIETYEKLLRLKSARGRPHVAALSGIAKAYKN